MSQENRREFLVAGAAAGVLAAEPARAQKRRVTVGLIGTGGMGTNHVRLLSRRADVNLKWLCDVDRERLAAGVDAARMSSGSVPQTTGDLRQVLADTSVEAVWIATPDHWHTPAALLALAAGKHVYVEKPCSHNIREGRWLVEGAAKSGKLCQVGTQSRSTAVVQEAIQRLRAGEIGEIKVAKAWNSQRRRDIGHQSPSEPPAGLDYDTWLGPAPRVPYRSNLLPGIWRWWYDFGCGDIGNDGVHDIDVALWGLGESTHPNRITCLGGKYHFDDDQQFPDTQYAVFEYTQTGKPLQTRQLIFEQRIWSPYVQEGYENGAAFYGTKGLMIVGHAIGWKLYGERNRLVAERAGPADLVAHHDNFLQAVRGETATLNATAHSGHLAASICHLANLAARTGRVIHFDPERERVIGDSEADRLVGRKYRKDHWGTPAEARS